jgi:SAM-dependent methyltransferase
MSGGCQLPATRDASRDGGEAVTLAAYRESIDRFNRSQPNRPLLDGIRAYNHQILDNLEQIQSLRGRFLLDIGASPHGYALERALEHGASLYVGVGLDIARPERVVGEGHRVGVLLEADAACLPFPTAMFDLVLSMSTLEHVEDVEAVLTEIARVLRPGGQALLTFEPVWSGSYGHHLHHFGECARLVPPWAHLWWTPDDMRRSLTGRWPSDAPLSLEQAIDWVYASRAINRLTVHDFRSRLRRCPLTVEWLVDLKEDGVDPAEAERVADRTGLSVDDLTTKGLSALLRRDA